MHTATAQSNLTGDSSPVFFAGRKATLIQKARLWELFSDNPQCPTPLMLKQLEETQEQIPVSGRQVNRFRKEWKLNRPKGRPSLTTSVQNSPSRGELVEVIAHLRFVGVHVFAHWMEQQEGFGGVIELMVEAIQGYISKNPQEDFALLHHREQTLMLRFEAIFYAPLLGIEKLTEFDYKENPLKTLIGRTYQNSTLSQFLGQLERIDAGSSLMPALIPDSSGKFGYVDGHLIAFWTRISMHKGKITMLGRIMAGSEAVIAHNEEGSALFVEYYPPDMHLTQVIVEYCRKIVQAMGIRLFVIDREVNSVKMACEFESQGWGLLCMLDANEYEGLSSFDASRIGELEDGSPVYEGPWKIRRQGDPRHFVIVVETQRVLVFWGTSLVKEEVDPIAWPKVYRERNEIQEKSFKRMIAYEALNVNYGTKKIEGPDRHQQRAKEEVSKAILAVEKKVEKKESKVKESQEKVEESKEKGHGKRLEQRERKLGVKQEELAKAQHKQHKLEAKAIELGEPKSRADRDFRKQKVMTFRSLLLDNALVAFVMALCGKLSEKVSLESIVNLLFERSASRIENESEILYWVNSGGLSLGHSRELTRIVEGINGMELKHKGKAVRVRLREAPT